VSLDAAIAITIVVTIAVLLQKITLQKTVLPDAVGADTILLKLIQAATIILIVKQKPAATVITDLHAENVLVAECL
jgi:hypothetical protein